MLTTFDLSSVLAYKIMKEHDIHAQTEFSKEELEQYFIKVLNMAKEVGCDWEKITEDQILEIKDRLSDFCEIQDAGIEIDNKEFNPKGRRRASMYVQGMDYALLWCCAKTLSSELKTEEDLKTI